MTAGDSVFWASSGSNAKIVLTHAIPVIITGPTPSSARRFVVVVKRAVVVAPTVAGRCPRTGTFFVHVPKY